MPLSPAPPPARWAPAPATSGGQAAVELVALLPLVAIVLAAGYQAVVAGDALWEAHAAARAAARASSFGADAAQAARAHLPSRLEHGLEVHAESGGDVRVSLRIPNIIPAVRLGSVAATAHFQPQGG
jgi:hypothetical protein